MGFSHARRRGHTSGRGHRCGDAGEGRPGRGGGFPRRKASIRRDGAVRRAEPGRPPPRSPARPGPFPVLWRTLPSPPRSVAPPPGRGLRPEVSRGGTNPPPSGRREPRCRRGGLTFQLGAPPPPQHASPLPNAALPVPTAVPSRLAAPGPAGSPGPARAKRAGAERGGGGGSAPLALSLRRVRGGRSFLRLYIARSVCFPPRRVTPGEILAICSAVINWL